MSEVDDAYVVADRRDPAALYPAILGACSARLLSAGSVVVAVLAPNGRSGNFLELVMATVRPVQAMEADPPDERWRTSDSSCDAPICLLGRPKAAPAVGGPATA